MRSGGRQVLEIIPAVDILGGSAVRLTGGSYDTAKAYRADAADAARFWADEGATRLHVVDLDGAKAGRLVNRAAVERIRAAFAGVIDVSGGIRGIEDVEAVLGLGADLVALGTSLLGGAGANGAASLGAEACGRFPGRVLASADLKGGVAMKHGWTEGSGIGAAELASAIAACGIEAVIVTDVLKDGGLKGPSIESVLPFSNAGLKVIVSGGIGSLEDIRRVAEAKAQGAGFGSITGIIVGKALYEGRFSFRQAMEASVC